MTDLNTRLTELRTRSRRRNEYTYTDFLTPSEISDATALYGDEITFFGGVDFAERKIACFGCSKDFGYEYEPPITVLKISPFVARFIDELNHRDVLGSVLALGIERSKIGDIFIDGKEAYVVAYNTVSRLLLDELSRVGRVSVEIEEVNFVPDEFRPKTIEKTLSVASMRYDAIVGATFNISREKSAELFSVKRVSVNFKVVEDGSKRVKPGDVVSVRGFGKFVVGEEGGVSRKGKTFVNVFVYA